MAAVNPSTRSIQATWSPEMERLNARRHGRFGVYIEKTETESSTHYEVKPIQAKSRLGRWLQEHVTLFNMIYTLFAKMNLANRASIQVLDAKIGRQDRAAELKIARELGTAHPVAIEAFDTIYWKDEKHFAADYSKYILAVRSKDLQEHPERILSCFDRLCYRSDPRVKDLKVNFLTPILEKDEGIDAGGLSRHFMSTFFQGLAEQSRNDALENMKFSHESTGMLPEWTGEENPQLYEALGKLMGFCATEDYYTGQVFDPRLFAMIQACDGIDLHKSVDQLTAREKITIYAAYLNANPSDDGSDHSLKQLVSYAALSKEEFTNPEVLYYAFDDEDEWPQACQDDQSPEVLQQCYDEIQAALEEQLVQVANGKVSAAFYIAKGFGKHINEHAPQMRSSSYQFLMDEVQGRFSKELVIANLTGPEPSLGHLQRWVRESDEELVKRFVKAVTGATSISAETDLRIDQYGGWDNDRLPTYHTCFNSLDMPAYSSYEQMKQKLEESIEYALAGNGFQAG